LKLKDFSPKQLEECKLKLPEWKGYMFLQGNSFFHSGGGTMVFKPGFLNRSDWKIVEDVELKLKEFLKSIDPKDDGSYFVSWERIKEEARKSFGVDLIE